PSWRIRSGQAYLRNGGAPDMWRQVERDRQTERKRTLEKVLVFDRAKAVTCTGHFEVTVPYYPKASSGHYRSNGPKFDGVRAKLSGTTYQDVTLTLSLTPTALRRIGRTTKMGAANGSQNDFWKNRTLLVDLTRCAGIKSNAFRGPRGKLSLQLCIPFDTILVRPYKLSHSTKGEQLWPTR